jgi:hypothetical protein
MKLALIIAAIGMAVVLHMVQDAREVERHNPQQFVPCTYDPQTGEPMLTPCDEN